MTAGIVGDGIGDLVLAGEELGLEALQYRDAMGQARVAPRGLLRAQGGGGARHVGRCRRREMEIHLASARIANIDRLGLCHRGSGKCAQGANEGFIGFEDIPLRQLAWSHPGEALTIERMRLAAP